ncbi:MAG TPA: mechanosensitive ion channel family protein [bacterium]|nr:mechanosensitive ion channel family protein [bacterium]
MVYPPAEQVALGAADQGGGDTQDPGRGLSRFPAGLMPLPDALRQAVHEALASPLAGVIVRLILIAAAAWVALRGSLAVVRRAGLRLTGHPAPTITHVLESAVRYAIAFAALVLMLDAVHVNITAVLASAGVVGVALGFGAQYLIRDILAGFFLLSEGVVQIGDWVRIDGDMGAVERITLRTTQIRKYSGELLTIPNGSIGRIGNLTRDYSRAIVQVIVPYQADVRAALEALRDVGHEWAAAHPEDALGEPAVDGAVDLKATGVTLQLSVRVRPGRQFAAEPDLRQRALQALAGRGIPTPSVLPIPS